MKKKQDENKSSLNSFIIALSNNLGVDLEKGNKKKTFNPFLIENADYIVTLYTLMNLYSRKNKRNIIIPTDIVIPKGEKKVKFIFKKDLNIDTISDIIEKNELNNVNIDEDNSIEICKKSKIIK